MRARVLLFCWCFEGVLGKVGVWMWFFDGQNVVLCVVNVEIKTTFPGHEKIRHVFPLYFSAVLILGKKNRKDKYRDPSLCSGDGKEQTRALPQLLPNHDGRTSKNRCWALATRQPAMRLRTAVLDGSKAGC